MKNPILQESFDNSIRPADDFFHFVNQRWIHENPIPPDESKWGSFYVLRVEVERQVKKILEGLEAKTDADIASRARKVRDFYRTGMDSARRDEQGDTPLAELFAAVDAAQNVADLARVVGVLHRSGVDVWWSPQADADAKQSDVVAFYINQGGIGLPDRDYYLRDDQKSAEIREK